MFRAFFRTSFPVPAAFALSLALIACDPDRGGSGPGDSGFQKDFPSAKALNARLGRGVNLGNALDAPTEGAWGVTLKADYFRRIADSGFASVRIPVRFSAHALAAAPYTLDTAFMNRVAWAVDEALKNKLLVVLDMHHYEEIMAKPAAELPRFLSMWRQIAKRFGAYPPELIFELLNEPRERLDAATWNGILAIALDTLRAAQPGRTVVVGTSPWGGLSGLGSLSLPDGDRNLIVAVHYYEPHSFTHQGASFEAGADAWLGTRWRATPAQRAGIDQDLAFIREWAEGQDRPVYMGEFGSIIRADSISRALYTEYLSRKFDTAGFSSALWNYSSDFGIVNDTTDAWRGYLSDALLHHGRNPMLDSILAADKPIDVGTYVTFDDFEDSLPRLSASGRQWRESQGIPLTAGGANWYIYTSDSSTISAGNGTRIHNYREVDSGKAAPNFDLLIGAWGSQGQGLHAKTRLLGGNYPFAGLGAGILGGWDSGFADLSKLTAIQFRAKGYGEWILQVVSDSVNADTIESWGHMAYTFRPKAEWETFTVPAEALAPLKYSRQAKMGLKWEDVRKKIIALEFLHGQSYGMVVDTTLEIWLDDIRLIGLKNGDLGM